MYKSNWIMSFLHTSCIYFYVAFYLYKNRRKEWYRFLPFFCVYFVVLFASTNVLTLYNFGTHNWKSLNSKLKRTAIKCHSFRHLTTGSHVPWTRPTLIAAAPETDAPLNRFVSNRIDFIVGTRFLELLE